MSHSKKIISAGLWNPGLTSRHSISTFCSLLENIQNSKYLDGVRCIFGLHSYQSHWLLILKMLWRFTTVSFSMIRDRDFIVVLHPFSKNISRLNVFHINQLNILYKWVKKKRNMKLFITFEIWYAVIFYSLANKVFMSHYNTRTNSNYCDTSVVFYWSGNLIFFCCLQSFILISFVLFDRCFK